MQLLHMPEHSLCMGVLDAPYEQHQRIELCVKGDQELPILFDPSVVLSSHSRKPYPYLQAERGVGRVRW